MIGGGAVRGGDLLLEPAREVVAERALPPTREAVRDRARPLRRRVGDDGRRAAGARSLARRERAGSSSARRRSGTSRTSPCACCRRCARPTWWPARTRAGRGCCWTATGCKARLVSYHEHNERARAAELVGGCATGRWWRSCRTPACRWCRTRATCSCAGAWRPGCRWRCCRGRRRRSPRWWRRGCRPTSGTSTASCRARRASCGACSPSRCGTLVAFESPRRLPATLALLAELDPEREVAVCRELTKVHEEVVRGTAAELAARYAAAPPKGEIVLVLAPLEPAASDAPDPAAARRAAPARGRRRAPAEGRHRGGRADRRQRKRAVPGADFRSNEPQQPCDRAVSTRRTHARTLRSADAPTPTHLRCRSLVFAPRRAARCVELAGPG